MVLPGNADLERTLILLVMVGIFVMVGIAMGWVRPRVLAPQVPPVVSPMQSPLDEEVKRIRHNQDNVLQKLPDLESRVLRQEAQLAAVREDMGEIKAGLQRTEHMLQVLVEHGLKRDAK